MSVTEQQVITKKELEICHNLFKLIDTDDNNSINVSELKDFIKEMGYHPSDRELFTLISDLNITQTNKIKFEDFLNILVKEKIEREHEND